MKKIAGFLVRNRNLLLVVMLAVTVGCGLLIPRININSDMTLYLPDDSRMKQGLDTMKTVFPDLDMNAYVVSAMFRNVEDKLTLTQDILEFKGLEKLMGTRDSGEYTLFQFSVADGADPKAIAARIRERYGDEVVVETNANSIMPDNILFILIAGVVMVFGILFLMCSSFMEAFLFILTICFAVVMNMGTNAFLPSVSMLTNTIVAVLQLVLSMDYSIILMNRYRQEKAKTDDSVEAMGNALSLAAPPIMSSCLTTVVGLVMLVFMKFKLGMDLGIVLSKGVVCSLISIFTMLPALVLLCEKAIKATEKKVFLIGTDPLADFEHRFGIPLAIFFVLVFAGSYVLHNRTELSFANVWTSEISDRFAPQNPLMVLYHNEDEEAVIGLVDSVSQEEKVSAALSYPSLILKKHTVPEMADHLRGLLGMSPDAASAVDTTLLNEDMLKIVYYAITHPQRDERMSFGDIQELGEDLSSSGLVPDSLDVETMIAQYASRLMPAEEPQPAPVASQEEAAEAQMQQTAVPTEVSPAVQMPVDSTATAALPQQADTSAVTAPASRFNYENVTREIDSPQLADFLGFDRSQAATIYRMAGKKNGVMSPRDFIRFIYDKVLTNKLYKTFISKSQTRDLAVARHQMDSAYLAGPTPVPAVQPGEAPTVQEMPQADTLATAAPALADARQTAADSLSASPAEQPKVIVPEKPGTPLEVLTDMALSGRKYTSSRIHSALSAAGIDIDANLVDLIFLVYGSRTAFEDSTKLSTGDLLDFVTGDLLTDETFSPFIDDNARTMLSGMKEQMSEGLGALRGERFSMAAIVTDFPVESKETHLFIDRLSDECDTLLGENDYYIIGEPVMYKEMKEGFKKELSLITILTVAAIFLIVVLTFRSVVIPILLIMTVLSGVYVNVFVSGIGGDTMLYLAYLIVQSILVGSTIDYGILFSSYYVESRAAYDVRESLRRAYRGSIHTIMTSGLIITVAPYVMSLLMTDPTLKSILSSLAVGAVAVIVLILLVLPATLAALDRVVVRKRNQ